MANKKDFLEDFYLGDKPDEDEPAVALDYTDLTTGKTAESDSASETAEKKPAKKKSTGKKPTEKKREEGATKSRSTSSRTRLNITDDKRDQLDDIVREMQRVGPERYLKASEVVDALISALHGARDQLDMGMMRRRGKFGSKQHDMYRAALASSIRATIAGQRKD